MFEKLVEVLFSIVATMSVEKIMLLKNQYTNQRILYLTADQYVNADHFRTEYRDVTAYIDKDIVLSIDSEKIEPSKTIEELSENLYPIFDEMIITDDRQLRNSIILAIATQYKTKRNLVINLFDILEQQRKDTDAIIAKIDTVDEKTILIADSILKKEKLKEQAIRSGIGRKMEQHILDAARYYIIAVTKKPPITTMDNTELSQLIYSIRQQIENDFPLIDAAFLSKPVSIIQPDPNGSIIPVKKELDVLHFWSLYLKRMQEGLDELLKYTNLLPDNFIILMIAYSNELESGFISSAIKHGLSPMIKNAVISDEENYVNGIKAYFRKLGEIIIDMSCH